MEAHVLSRTSLPLALASWGLTFTLGIGPRVTFGFWSLNLMGDLGVGKLAPFPWTWCSFSLVAAQLRHCNVDLTSSSFLLRRFSVPWKIGEGTVTLFAILSSAKGP